MRILAINVEIGYGHPNYLDYVIQGIRYIQPKIEIISWDVLSQEKRLVKIFWQISKKIYYCGAGGGISTKIYNKLRDYPKPISFPICRISTQDYATVIASHPLLARFLKRIWYIHGDIAVPKECILTDVEKIVVPIKDTAQKIINQGVTKEHIYETGLLIPPELSRNAEEIFFKRQIRLSTSQSLTIGFCISGAYPKPHIKKIIAAIASLQKTSHRMIVFLGINQRKADKFVKQLNIKCQPTKGNLATILFVRGNDRPDYQKKVNSLLPLLDLVIAPSHEYTNWAIGLGLPMLSLFPMIGGYAQENYEFLIKQGVTYPIQTDRDADNFREIIHHLHRSGKLLKMAQNGFGKYEIDGAMKTAQLILSELD